MGIPPPVVIPRAALMARPMRPAKASFSDASAAANPRRVNDKPSRKSRIALAAELISRISFGDSNRTGVVSVEEVGNSVAGSVFVGTEAGEHAGSSLAGVGDIDGGGNADFLVGAPNLDSSTGTVYIVLPDDGDDDGRADTLDCNPSSGSIWDVPSEVREIAFTHNAGSGITTISWTVPIELGAIAGPSYDTIRAANPADFVGSGVCVETDGTDTSSTDAFNPLPDGTAFYLVVAQNACGSGIAGTNSTETPIIARICP